MNLTKIAASDCKDGDCPAVYRTDRGAIGVQGYLLDRPTPEGEGLVEIPVELLVEACHPVRVLMGLCLQRRGWRGYPGPGCD